MAEPLEPRCPGCGRTLRELNAMLGGAREGETEER